MQRMRIIRYVRMGYAMGQLTIWGEVEKPTADRPSRKNWRWAIPELLVEADHRCAVCGGEIRGEGAAHVWVEHLVPLTRGGADTRDNLGVSHPICNLARSNRYLDDPWVAENRARLRDIAARPLSERTCIDCDTSIAHRGWYASRCELCQRSHKLELLREGLRRRRLESPDSIRARDRAYWNKNRDRLNALRNARRARFGR